jgi:EXPERA (EXPanded EBP superfamily)
MAVPIAVRDGVYLVTIAAQLFGMLGKFTIHLGSSFASARSTANGVPSAMDLVPFYPKALWEAPTAPFHSITAIRSTYVSLTGDPFFAHDLHEPWFQAFLYIEACVQLPLALYLVYKLSGGTWSSSAAKELAALAFGCVTGMGSTTCCYYLWTLGESMVTPAQKTMLFWGEYLPYAIIRESNALSMTTD